MSGEDAVRALWRLFDEGRFDAVRPLLADDFSADWPQTRERIAGPDNFIALNAAYPGRWRCHLRHLHGLGDTVISEVEIGDGRATVHAVSVSPCAQAAWPTPANTSATPANHPTTAAGGPSGTRHRRAVVQRSTQGREHGAPPSASDRQTDSAVEAPRGRQPTKSRHKQARSNRILFATDRDFRFPLSSRLLLHHQCLVSRAVQSKANGLPPPQQVDAQRPLEQHTNHPLLE